jgi:hypothetical protein
MTVQTLVPAAFPAPEAPRSVLASDDAPLPLRTELFLIAHDHDTGRPHVSRRRLELALAGAVLLDLWLAGRIQIGWRYDVRSGGWEPAPGRITVLRDESVGDPLADSVLATLCRTATPQVHAFVRDLVATGLYDRVAADMIAAGILRRRSARRWFGLSRRGPYQPVSESFAVRVRNRLRDLVTGTPRLGEWQAGEQHERHGTGLAALVLVLGLMRHLYSGLEPARLRHVLLDLVNNRPGESIRDVAAAVGRSRG